MFALVEADSQALDWESFCAKCREVTQEKNRNQEVLARSVWAVMDKYGMRESAEGCSSGYTQLKASVLAGATRETFVLGWIHDFGVGREVDSKKAVALYRVAARKV